MTVEGRTGTPPPRGDAAVVVPAAREPAPAETGPGGPARGRPSGRRRLLHATLPGAWVALVFACLSFTPSLLPRDGVFQGAVTGVTAAVGYGLGVLAAWVWREVADRAEAGPRPSSARAWRWFAVTAAVTLGLSWVLGQRWQDQIRSLMDAPGEGVASRLLMPVVAVVVLGLVLLTGRALRRVYRVLAALLRRWIGARAARGVGWLLVVAGTAGLFSGVVLDAAVSAADRTFALRDLITPEDVERPTTALRSGGDGSVISWDSLGREGRTFTGRGPTADQIAGFTGRPALEPVRVFAGLASADSTEERAQLAVEDLERAGGFQRAELLVATTTGSGWLERSAVDSFEYLAGGDSAIVGLQYSNLPSWISYLVDQDAARAAGRELFDAVYERWSALPADDRPRLLVFGESLGSFGAEAAFSGEFDLRNRTDGALFVGPAGFNTLYTEFTDDRDPGSPEVEPVYRQGRTVRFTDRPGDPADPASQPWDGTRVLYVQHASDPIVWWDTDLLLRRPDWLEEPPGADVLDEMVWIPFVTFWQVAADLPMATAVPAGHGHSYTGEHADAWATVLRTPDWTSEKAAELRRILRGS